MEQKEEKLSEEQTNKKIRHRKKQLYSSILNQMEFYFSDSNLSKDRFLSQLIKENPYVSLETFFKFNKIRKLTTSIEDIQKALSKSNLIELSEDKMSVCRKEPLKEKPNEEDCTVYVEKIKPDTNHEFLNQLFSEFGTVVYVSIPKFKHNKANKGFAFVEFNTENEAKSCLDYFESIGLKMPSNTEPEELLSTKTFETGDKQEETENGKEKMEQVDEEKTNKRKFDEVNNEEKDKESVKKLKTNIDLLDEEDGERKKKKQKKKKNMFKELGLHVLSKKEWRQIRNRYLNLQRKKMKEFKQHLAKAKFCNPDYNKKSEEKPVQQDPGMEFVPGVIVKIKLKETCQDIKKTKNEVKALSQDIKFVDIPHVGTDEIYVRFGNSESAKEFFSQEKFEKSLILEGEEENQYWQRLQDTREKKLNREKKKHRGRDKLLKKAQKLESNTHIKFDE